MQIRLVLASALLCVFAAAAASAMDEQHMAAPLPQSGAPSASPAAPSAEIGTPAAETDAEEGTEIRIPGIGKLGTLPKMDFGLDLLYGAAETRQQNLQQDPTAEPVPDDLTIRGSVKHRF